MSDKVLAHQFFVVRDSQGKALCAFPGKTGATFLELLQRQRDPARMRRDYIVGLLGPFAVTAESLPFLTKVGFA
ncbi:MULTISPECIES: hypothetical protein [Mesorhizobium]|uniref:hypothetical protein n=1 Tax=Mesorhizobium TaxID=68287 RepID=UPI001459FEC1|nr:MULTISPECIES: hypothetical protein [Mesorhizobium]